MITNVVTPPDLIPTVVIIDASTEQVQSCAAVIKGQESVYNIYLYNHEMNDLTWLSKVIKRADVVLQAEGSTVPVLEKQLFGPNQTLTQPKDFFNK
jgi:ornithine cyclodeaminase/alanine dehydrogenase-like protein (mu-crystallin family)